MLKNALESDRKIIKRYNYLEFAYIWKEFFCKNQERRWRTMLKKSAIYIVKNSRLTPIINKLLPPNSGRRSYVKNTIKRIIKKIKLKISHS